MADTPKPPIHEVLTHYGAEGVPDSGGWRSLRCPFHGDRSASASVKPDEDLFKCHVCDVGGDSFTVVAWKEGINDFPDTVRFCEKENFWRKLRPRTSGKWTDTNAPERIGRHVSAPTLRTARHTFESA
ncbi:CHC2 zinc finger domain-containing protein [Yinghuangia aomiensis]